MTDISKNILERPARRWKLNAERQMWFGDDGRGNCAFDCARRFTAAPGVNAMVRFTLVHGMTLKLDAWWSALLESAQTIDFRHVTGLVDGIGVSELWAVDRLASRDDQPAMRARKQFTPAQRAIVAEWHKRELAMLAQERA